MPARSLRIVHVIAGLQASGAEIALYRLVAQSGANGLSHTVVSLTGRGELAPDLEAVGCRVVSLGLRPGLQLPLDLIRAARTLAGLKPDVIQGWMVHGNLVAWATRLLLHRRAKLAWNLRMSLKNAVYESARTLRLTQWAGQASRTVDLLISNSAAGLEDHLAIGYAPRGTAVIPNGYDPEIFRPDPLVRSRMRRDWDMPDHAVVFGLIGRYHAVKGHDVFIQAAALARAHDDMMFVLAGRDASPGNPELNAALERHGLKERFRLLGARSDIPAVLCGLDVVCIPSVYEGFPNSLGEAMAAGLPCIATDVSDVARIMGDSGRLIAVGDGQGLADAMADLAALGPAGRASLGERARERILKNYSLARVAADYGERYRALVEGERRLDGSQRAHARQGETA